MVIEGLPIPPRLLALDRVGAWPIRHTELLQRLDVVVPAATVRELAPEQAELVLYPVEDFRTVARELVYNAEFWTEFGALHEIDPALALIIGDFGLGSDAAIVLDYRGPHEPYRTSSEARVLRLRWPNDGTKHTTWVQCAASFDDFAERLNLGRDHSPAK